MAQNYNILLSRRQLTKLVISGLRLIIRAPELSLENWYSGEA